MNTLIFDLETESPVDLRYTNAGVYFAHPETRIIAAAFAEGEDGEVRICDELTGLEAFYAAVKHADILVAHNAGFDFTGIKVDPAAEKKLRCTMAMSYTLNCPGGLRDAAEAINSHHFKQDEPVLLEKQRKSRWKHTLAGFVPYREAPKEDRDQLLEYAMEDVEATRELYYRLLAHTPEEELDYIDAHLRINLRGVPFRTSKVQEVYEKEVANKEATIAEYEARFGFKPSNINKIKETLAAKLGRVMPDAQAATLEGVKTITEDEEVHALIDGRFALTGSNADRFQRILDRAEGKDEEICKVRDEFVFAPAITSRFSARGAQMHNCPRGGDARHCVVAPPGYEIYTADFAQIELRIGLWVVTADERLTQLHEGALYEAAAAEVYGVPINEVTKQQRHLGKTLYLGGMYQAGGKSFQKFAEGYGIPLTTERATELIQQFRCDHPEFVRAWRSLPEAALDALAGGERIKPEGVRCVSYEKKHYGDGSHALLAHLPTGRSIKYWDATLRQEEKFGRLSTFFDYAAVKGSKRRIFMHHGGKQLENISQAVGRDLLCQSIQRFQKALHPDEGVILHVHDELVVLVRKGRDKDELDELFLPKEWRVPPGKGGLVLDCETHLTQSWGEAK